MNNDQRLFPFLGGLVLGGVGGAFAEGNKMNYNNYPYYYQQPYNNYYQYPVNNYNYYPYAYNQHTLPVNSTQYPQYNNMPYNQYQFNTDIIAPGKIIEETPVPVLYTTDTRGIEDLSYVPKYRP